MLPRRSMASNHENMSQNALRSVCATLSREEEAVLRLALQYRTNEWSQVQLLNSLEILFRTHERRGKIVVCGIGKLFKVATKLVATLNSLSILSQELHPAEALHGDLGMLRENDCIILLTASGNTPELLLLLPHVSKNIPIVLLTSNKKLKLSSHPQIRSLLYAELPPHLKEDSIHGLPAPTVSMTLALALADATVLALSEMIDSDVLRRKKVFSMKHPGGSIGADLSHLNDNLVSTEDSKKAFGGSHSSSILSLTDIRKGIFDVESDSSKNRNTVASSLTSSDDEETQQTPKQTHIQLPLGGQAIDAALSACVKACPSYQIMRTSEAELLRVSEVDLFKWTAIYDYVLYMTESKNTYAISTADIRAAMRLEISQGYTEDVWRVFVANLNNDFKPVAV